MLAIEPSSLVFRDVQINKSYSSTICLTNPLDVTANITIKPNSSRYTVTPNNISLLAGQSIIVSVRLFVAHYPNYPKGINEGQDDFIIIKSAFFEQKINLKFYLYPKNELSRSSSRSPSPNRTQSKSNQPTNELLILQSKLLMKDNEIKQLQNIISDFESKNPSIQQIIKNRVDQERALFEEKSDKVLKILRRKDDTIKSLQDQVQQHELAIKDKQSTIDNYSQDILKLKKELQSNQLVIDELNNKIYSIRNDNDYESWKEKYIDQSQQMDVLISEVSRLRQESSNEIKLQDDIERLNSQLSTQFSLINELKQSNEMLQSELSLNRMKFEDNIEGGIGLATPNRFNSFQEDSSKLLQDRSIQLELYQERSQQANKQIEELKDQLVNQNSKEQKLFERIESLENELELAQKNLLSFQNNNQELKHSKDLLDNKLQETLTQLSNTKDRLASCLQQAHVHDTHTWWAYIWHEMKKFGNSENDVFRSSNISSNSDILRDNMRMKDIIRKQAIEISTTRQELLGKRLTCQKEIETHKDQIELLNLEINRLMNQIKLHRNDKELRINELSTTIRVLTSKSDLHRQYIDLAKDLETEKLTTFHLQSELESYRVLVDSNQRKINELRNEITSLKSTVDSVDVLRTVTNIPGVDPSTVIELTAKELVDMSTEIKQTKALLNKANNTIESLHRSMNISHYPVNDSISEDSINDSTNNYITNNVDKLFEVLDSQMLSSQLNVKDSIISDLQLQISNLQKQLLDTNSDTSVDKPIDIQGYIEKDKYDLLLLSYEENNQLINELRSELLDKSKQLLEMRSTSNITKGFSEEKQIDSDIYLTSRSLDLLDNQLDKDIDRQIDTEISSKLHVNLDNRTDVKIQDELNEVKHLLRERTIQLKVLMETLDSFESSNISSNQLTNYSSNMSMSDNGWVVKGLVKRIMELTNELTSMISTHSIDTKQYNNLMKSNKKLANENLTMKSNSAKHSYIVKELNSRITLISNQLKDKEQIFNQLISNLQSDSNRLLDQIHELQLSNQLKENKINELNQNIRLSNNQNEFDLNDYKQWIESIVLNIPNSISTQALDSTTYLPIEADDNIKDLLVKLLNKYHDEVDLKDTVVITNNPKEQMFIQRIIALVLSINNKYNNLCISNQQLIHQNKQQAIQSDIITGRLDKCLHQLFIFKRRSIAIDKIILTSNPSTIEFSKSLTIYKNLYISERKRYIDISDKLINERRSAIISQLNERSNEQYIELLNSQIAELQLQHIDNSTNYISSSSIDSTIKLYEESLQKWFRVELPRLIAGIPVTEETSISNQLIIDLGFDKSYALSQSLLLSKATISSLEIKITSLLDQLNKLKDKNYSLEGLIFEWKDQINKSKRSNLLSVDVTSKQSYTFDDVSQIIDKYNDETRTLTSTVNQLTDKLLDYEDQNIELRGRIDISARTIKELQNTIETLANNEKQSINVSKDYLTNIRIKMRDEYTNELELVRGNYENEKKILLDEIDRLVVAAEIANVNIQLDRSIDRYNKSIQTDVILLDRVDSTNQPYRSDKSTASDDLYYNDVDRSTNENLLLDRNKYLEMSLDQEKQRSSQIRQEVHELEQLLSLQRSAIHHQMDRQIDQQVVSKIDIKAIEEIISKEDQSVWPDISLQTTSLIDLLKSLSTNPINIEMLIQSAIAVVYRIQQSTQKLLVSKTKNDTDKMMDSKIDSESSKIDTKIDKNVKTDRQQSDNELDQLFRDNLLNITTRVHNIENDFNDQQISEKHLYLLRDLRIKLSDLERQMSDEMAFHQKEWSIERSSHLSDIKTLRDTISTLKKDHTEISNSVRDRYENSLKEVQDALEQQTNAARDEIQRLTEVINKLQLNMTDNNVKANIDSYRNEINELRNQLATKEDIIQQYRNQLSTLQSQHILDINETKQHYNRYSQAQEMIINTLNNQIEELRSNTAIDPLLTYDYTLDLNTINNTNSSIDVDDRIRKLEYKYNAKTMELEAVMKSLAKSTLSTTTTSSINEYGSNTSSDTSIRNEINEARILASEREIDALNYLINQEKRISTQLQSKCLLLQRQLDKMLANNLSTPVPPIIQSNSQTQVRIEPSDEVLEEQVAYKPIETSNQPTQTSPLTIATMAVNTRSHSIQSVITGVDSFLVNTSNEIAAPALDLSISNLSNRTTLLTKEKQNNDRLKAFVKRVNDMRRHARAEIQRVKEYLLANQDTTKDSFSSLQATLQDTKDQITAIREDNNRKLKLITSLRNQRTTDSLLIDKLKQEIKEYDENIKRLNRAINSKDALVKDLKSKIQQLEETIEKLESKASSLGISLTNPSDSTSTDNMMNVPVNELRSRLKDCESDRNRNKQRITSLKEKINELELENKLIKEEIDNYKKINERVDVLKLSNNKKDLVIKQFNNQIDELQNVNEKLVNELRDYKINCERRIKDLEHKLSISDRNLKDSEKENQHMRQRLNDLLEANRIKEESQTQSNNKEDDYISNTVNKSVLKNKLTNLPAPLASTESAINDVMESLGMLEKESKPKLRFSNNVTVDSDATIEITSGLSSDTERRLKAIVDAALLSSPLGKKQPTTTTSR